MAEFKSSDVLIIKDSGLFDVNFYLTTYPDVRDANVDPIEHYLEHGAFEGRNPSKSFNTNDYRNDGNGANFLHPNPLMNFILVAKAKSSKEIASRDLQIFDSDGRNFVANDDDFASRVIDLASRYFDEPLISKLEFLQTVSEKDALALIGPSVDVDYYIRVYPDIDISQVDPALHFLILRMA